MTLGPNWPIPDMSNLASCADQAQQNQRLTKAAILSQKQKQFWKNSVIADI